MVSLYVHVENGVKVDRRLSGFIKLNNKPEKETQSLSYFIYFPLPVLKSSNPESLCQCINSGYITM